MGIISVRLPTEQHRLTKSRFIHSVYCTASDDKSFTTTA